jgi:DNA-binding transcriptional LysR family regulator
VSQLLEVLSYAEHMTLHASFRSNSVAALKRFVQATDGVTFMGAGLAFPAEAQAGALTSLDLAYPVSRKAKVRVVVRKGRPMTAAGAHLLKEIRRVFAAFQHAAEK